MMKKVCIITLNGNDNYGNKLQHIAVQNTIEKIGYEVQTLGFYHYDKMEYYIKHIFKIITRKRYRNFNRFDKKIKYYKNIFYKKNCDIDKNIQNDFDYFVVGSDQVWNSSIKTFRDFYLLTFVDNDDKKISLSASIGIDNISKQDEILFSKNLSKFKKISVREENAKKLLEKIVDRRDIEVLIDPTMMMKRSYWEKLCKKPSKMNELKNKKYILNYFLGNVSEDRINAINKIANDYNCEIINILDENSPFYSSGPAEFLYLEKNAFLICTDSFHSSVFSILFDVPFVVFDREQKNVQNMNSRIDTLIEKFDLKNRRYNGVSITKENLNHDYKEAYLKLEKEREKALEFLKKALDIKDSD